jgi:23S rRNA (pseudouridine1915-N3)-methyltransferase
MKIVVLSVGRVRQQFVLQGEGEYLQRIKGNFQVELVELGMESPESMSPSEVQAREADEVLKKTKPYDYLVVLDERGKSMTSKSLSDLIQARMNSGIKSVCFIIGGAYGFAEKVRQEADLILSLSAFTFPHQITRLLLVEQLYRAHTLMKGISYHK